MATPLKIGVPKLGKTLFILILVALAGLYLVSSSAFQVNYGTVAVLTRFGKIEGGVKKPGLHFKIPVIDKVVTYRTQKIVYETVRADTFENAAATGYRDYAVNTTTQDGQQISVTFTVRFQLDPTKIREIANEVGTEAEVVDKIVKTETRIQARNVPRSFSAFDLYTGNIDQVSADIAERIAPVMKENGLILDEFGIREILFNEEYVSTIEQKQIEKERVETEKFIAQQEEFKKQAAITKAQGEAEAQRLQQQSLNNLVIKKLYLEKWDGKLPNVISGDANGLILDISNL
ncbi:MAG: prohibitin family protein [Candidatus Dojkabacteria bacterium]